MAKILVATDGREWQAWVEDDFSTETIAAVEGSGFFDGVSVYVLLDEPSFGKDEGDTKRLWVGILETRVRVLWDLNQLIGELGFDCRSVKVTYRDETFTSEGSRVTMEVEARFGDVSPRMVGLEVQERQ